MKIKHYTFFTDTHKIFLKYFMNTYPFDSDIDLIIRHMPQECETGEFVTEGWNKTMKRKVEYILDSFIGMNDGDIFIHSDADIIFIRSYKDYIVKEMENLDLVFQSDAGTACMGFFACKVNDRTKKLFKNLYDDLHNHYHDQAAMFHILANTDHNVKHGLFSHQIFNHGFLGKHYEDEEYVNFPPDMIALHANFAVGVERKIKLIKIALKSFGLLK